MSFTIAPSPRHGQGIYAGVNMLAGAVVLRTRHARITHTMYIASTLNGFEVATDGVYYIVLRGSTAYLFNSGDEANQMNVAPVVLERASTTVTLEWRTTVRVPAGAELLWRYDYA